MMRYIHIFIMSFCIYLLAACADSDSALKIQKGETLLEVGASANYETVPDEARFSVGVETLAANGPAASKANDAIMQKLASELTKLNIEAGDVQTRNISINRITYGKDRGKFRANNLVDITVKDTDVVSKAIAAATSVGGNVVNGPNFQVSDPEKAKLENFKKAFSAARAKAEAYAEAANLKIGRVIHITDSSANQSSSNYSYDTEIYLEEAAADEAEGPPVYAGTSKDNISVNVRFALVAK